MFEDLQGAIGGITDASNNIVNAVAGAAENAKVAYDQAAGYWKPVGGGTPPGGFAGAGTDVTTAKAQNPSFLDKLRPFLLPGLVVVVIAGVVYVIWRAVKGKKKD